MSAVPVRAADAAARVVPLSGIPDGAADASVYLNLDGTPSELKELRSRIERSPFVAQYAFVSKAAAARIARQRHLPVSASDLPAGFRVRLAAPKKTISQFVASLADAPGLNEVVTPKRLSKAHGDCYPNGATVGVFLNDGATQSDFQGAQTTIENDPDVAAVAIVSSDQALAIYRCAIAPGIDMTATAEKFPTGLWVAPRRGANTTALRTRLRAIPGVQQVT